MSNNLKKFTFKVVLTGKALRESNVAVCFENCSDFMVLRDALSQVRLGALYRFPGQTAEYNARDRAGAIAQFRRDFPKMEIAD